MTNFLAHYSSGYHPQQLLGNPSMIQCDKWFSSLAETKQHTLHGNCNSKEPHFCIFDKEASKLSVLFTTGAALMI